MSSAETVLGLPRYMLLETKYRDQQTGFDEYKLLHYLWNDEFAPYYKGFGSVRDLDPASSPFVMLEVVPSTSRPTTHVHLRCSYNNKYLRLELHPTIAGLNYLVATANAPNESNTGSNESTLFSPRRFPGNIVSFEHNSGRWLQAPTFTAAYVYANEGDSGVFFKYLRWESFEDRLKAKDQEIKRLTDLLAEFHSSDGESLTPAEVIRELREHIAEQNKLIEELYEQIGSRPAAAEATTKAAAN